MRQKQAFHFRKRNLNFRKQKGENMPYSCVVKTCLSVICFDNYLQGMGKKKKRVTLVLNGTPQGEIKLLTNVGNGKAMECNFI